MTTDAKRTGRIRWGIIGCGDVTEKKSGPGFQKATGSELVAVMRRNADNAADYARRHGVATWYSDADQLIAAPNVDAVYIATHPDSHLTYAERAIAAGKPVYVEKPMTIGPAYSETIVAAARQAGVPLFVAYYRRGLEKYRAVKEMIDRGEVGTIRFVRVLVQQPAMLDPNAASENVPWRLDASRSGGGLIMDVGSHGLDLLDFYFGPVAAVQGISSNQSGVGAVEDTVSGTWRFESGVHGTGVWCFSSYTEDDRIEIYGTAGKIAFSVLDVAGDITVETAAGVQHYSYDPPEHVQQPLIQLVVDHLLGGAPAPSTGESALRTDYTLAALRASWYVGHAGDQT